MKASVVIANYNNAKFIEDCINSLNSQTYNNIEIIFFDDNSKDNSIEVKVGSIESMSKSKKNTIDPEKIIDSYGADSVRLFILSDSPPEKDVQWSEVGIISSFKFLQKLWSLHLKILGEIKKEHKKDSGKNLLKFTHKFIKK